VIGARGNVGAEVVDLQLHQGIPVRAAVRSPAAAGAGRAEVAFDFARPATFAPAFAGVERMFLMRPPAISDVERWMFPALDAARTAGIRQIVLLSLLGAERLPFVPHAKLEQRIKALGLQYTFLRPSFFMQNLSTTHRLEIKERSEIYVPAGRGKTSFVDARDVAAVAAAALTTPGHTDRSYDLTGAAALDYDQVAAVLSQALGRTISYRRPSLLRFILRQRAAGTPAAFIAVMAGIYTTARLGWAAKVTPDTARILDRAPITLAQYAADYRACW
jgi:uncharacterized protein YbjT (DUF2867 family)